MDGSERRHLVKRVQQAYATYLPAGKGFLPPVVPVDHLPAAFELYVRAGKTTQQVRRGERQCPPMARRPVLPV